MAKARPSVDRHSLYEAAVQNVEADLDFIDRVYKKINGKRARLLHEDFSGTASLACSWVSRRAKNEAIAVDLDNDVLEWGREHRVAPLGKAAARVTLLCADVRHIDRPRVDVRTAFNFSYCLFEDRAEMRRYFSTVKRSLRPGGLFFLDLFGGTESLCPIKEETKIEASRDPDGRHVPAFTYVWEQASFNPIDHHMDCHIHFRLRGKKMKRAFSYSWRLWTLPEIREMLSESGFGSVEVYTEGWDEESDESDGVFRLRRRFDNEGSWIANIVAGA